MVSHQPAKIDARRHYGSGDMFLSCHTISLDHMIQELHDFISRSTSRHMPTCQVWWP